MGKNVLAFNAVLFAKDMPAFDGSDGLNPLQSRFRSPKCPETLAIPEQPFQSCMIALGPVIQPFPANMRDKVSLQGEGRMAPGNDRDTKADLR